MTCDISPPASENIAIVVVLYHPSVEDIDNVLDMANWKLGSVVAVSNAISKERQRQLSTSAGVELVENERNVGLAKALNQGLKAALKNGASYILLLDQDSRATRTMVSHLARAARTVETEGRRLACVAPVLRDRKITASSKGSSDIAIATTFATSGTLVTRRACAEVGLMREDLFIDCIDHEWCFRARSRNFETIRVTDAIMMHDMGEDAIKIFGVFKPIHRSPMRHFFIVRNTLWLARCSYIPKTWRVRELVKVMYRIPIYVLVSHARAKSAKNLLFAIVDGISGRPSGNSRWA